MKADEIFLAAVEKQTPGERAAYLDGACGDNAELRARIGALLKSHEAAGSFLGQPLFASSPTIAPPTSVEDPGTIIGPYKLLQQIGEGGMGVVFLAEQTQPVQRKVALKVIKPGMDSRQIIARFEAERQALALMDHVNIARVLDAGATESGKPYFVMELVNGIPITKYCDDNHLTPCARLELFVPVCQAIQHAHQKGIIHRDIKPSNVMVTLYDGKPVPKVIDFGVAKATEQRLTERTLFTQHGATVGTLEYMSPEQAEMSALGVDTRSDVYSLGVLLYELLTGSTPLTKKQVKEAAFGEILRLIKEEEPQKPSTRLSESGDALASISTQRQMEPAKLSKLVKGELDWIVMKTLEKDRNRRYESASAFAVDVQRYLNDEPVQACPPSARYRLRKFARRNKTALTTLAAVALALLLGTGISIWQAVEARHARWLADERLENEKQAHDLAEEQRQRAQASYGKALEAVKKMLVEVGDETVSAVPEMQKWREHLLEEAIAFYGSLIALNPHDSESYVARAHVYRLLAKCDRERADLEKAIELEPLKAEYHHFLAFALRYSWNDDQRSLFHQKRAVELMPTGATRLGLADLYDHLGRKDEAIAEYRMAAEADPDTVEAYGSLAAVALLNGNLREARLNQEKAVECDLRGRRGNGHIGDYFSVNHGPTGRAWVYMQLARVYRRTGDDNQALTVLNRTLELTGVSGQARGWALLDRGRVYASQKKYAAALSDYDSAIQLNPEFRRQDGLLYIQRGLLHFNLGHYKQALADLAKRVEVQPDHVNNLQWIPVEEVAACPDEGFRKGILSLADRTITLLSANPGTQQGREADAYYVRAQLLAAMNQAERASADYERAFALYQQALEKQAAKFGPDHGETIKVMSNLAHAYANAGRFQEAIATYKEVIRIKPDYVLAHNNLAWILATCPDPKFRDSTEAVRLAQQTTKLAPSDGNNWNTLGAAQYRAGDWKAAVTTLEKSVELRKGGDSLDWFFLAMAHWQLNQKDEARKWCDQAVQWMEKNNSKDEELIRFRAEAAKLIGVTDKSNAEKGPLPKLDGAK